MHRRDIVPGIVVVDDHQRTGIVRQKEPRPPAEWLAQLAHAEQVAALPIDVQWWGILPLTGGYVLCPEPLLTPQRKATYEDFLTAVDHGNSAARRSLAKLFPEFTEKAVGELDALS
ncbi:MAG: hypothetical protein AAF657_01945 [Acidobacteriota bacterium]